jgi:hypothetical protein
MFWKHTLRVSNTCKGVLDYLWIESRIKNVANGGVCLGVVTAMGTAVHRPGLSGDRLAEAKDAGAEDGTAIVPVAPPPLGRCPPGGGQEQCVGVWAPVCPVYTARCMAMHHLRHRHPCPVSPP